MSLRDAVAGRGALLILVAVLAVATASAQEKSDPKKQDPAELFFRKTEPPRLVIEIPAASADGLRKEPRTYARASIHENGKTDYVDVGIKLKGAAGSYRDFDDRPGLTVNVDKFTKGQRFHGLEKFHLNNAVQDPSYLREWLAAEIFLAAGVPAARVTHCRLILGDRDMGVYVVKEGWDDTLLERYFANADGNLYDGGFCQEIDAELEKDAGKGPDDRSDLKALFAITKEPDAKKRWERLNAALDMKAFLTFTALELMTGHWDGYSVNRNNYRLFFDATTGKAHFLPHGMDQVFQDPNMSILDQPGAAVSAALMKYPEGRKAFRKRLSELLPLFSPVEKLHRRVDEAAARARPLFAQVGEDAARDFSARVRELKDTLSQRVKSLVEQNAQPEPKPLAFAGSTPVKIVGWRKTVECEDAAVLEGNNAGERAYTIKTGKSGRCIASFRKSVFLSKGKYKLRAILSTKDVEPLADSENPGAGIRIAGQNRDLRLVGNVSRKPVDFEFTVDEDSRNVELIVELNAAKGQLIVSADSLRLARL